MDLNTMIVVENYLGKLSQEQFYGTVELQFSDGEVILIRKSETLKPALLVMVQ